MSSDVKATLRALRLLDRHGALRTLVRGALPTEALQDLLASSLPSDARQALPVEVWAGLAAGLALESEEIGAALAGQLDDHLAWDTPPAALDDWWPVVVERPLEALWMAALSGRRDVRDEFEHIAGHCLENYRRSPAAVAPSWEFIEGILGVQAATARTLSEAQRRSAEAERRSDAARQRLEDLREELKRLRRENAELRAALAQAERSQQRDATPNPISPEREERLERRVRKLEKERTHLRLELERQRSGAAPAPEPPPEPEPEPEPERPAAEVGPELARDPDPRRRLLRFILRKLLKKSKIGGAHTHEDNLYRGLPDHEKGLAKQATELLYLEGFLIPKPTLSDPHVSLSPERVAEAREIIAGQIHNPRLRQFLERPRE